MKNEKKKKRINTLAQKVCKNLVLRSGGLNQLNLHDFCLWCLLWVCHFPIGILGQVWYLIVSIPDLCNLITFTLSKIHFSPTKLLYAYVKFVDIV